jgi:WD40 repeat protein
MTDPFAEREPAPDGPLESPYVGLVPYGEQDAAFFFGRGEEKRIVGGNLRAFRLTLFYGASGVGKTSLLRAGVVHDLRRHLHEHATRRVERAPFAVCVFSSWRDDPLAALMDTIRVAASEALHGEEVAPWQPGDAVAETLRSWTERVRTLLVVLDQFEDYFLYHPDEDGEGTFAGAFPSIVNDPNLRVNFLLSIREDALAKLDRFKGRVPRLFANYVRIEHLSRAAARDAIEGPIREWNRRLSPQEPPYALEPALVEAVIDAAAAGKLALGRGGSDADTAVPGMERIEAPFLQLVMERLWRATVAASSRDLTVARLEQLGGAQQIVENHLRDALGALAPGERAVAADLFRFLVTSSKTKIAHQVPDLVEWTGRAEPEVTTVLDRLCRGESGRILRRIPPPPTGDGDTRYELFHDVLAEPILEWRREYEQEQRRRATVRRFVRVGSVLASLVAVFAALGIWALVQRGEARSATRSATSLALASAASAQVDDHVEQSLLLGLEALRASPSAEASSAMVQALEVARRSGAKAILRGGADGVRTIAFSPDGSTLASADFDGALRLWDTKARTTLGEPLLGHTNEVWGLAFSPDGEVLASSSFDGTVRLWSVEEEGPLGAPIDADVGAVRSVAFSPDGRTVALGGSDDTVRLWEVGERRSAAPPLQGHRSSVMSVAFSPDGRTLASGGADRAVWLWDLRPGKPRGRALDGHVGKVVSVAFSPDGRTLASSDLAGDVRLWDARTGEPRGEALQSETGEVWSVAFSPDGRTLASSGFDGTVRLWDVRAGRVSSDALRGHSRAVIAVAYASDGTLASASFDGTARLWDVRKQSRLGEPLGSHEDRVTTLASSPDGRTLASGGFDRAIRLWDLRSRKSLGQLGEGRSDSLESVAFSPDGGTLASADVAGSIWLWEMPAGTPLGRLRGHDGAVQSIAFGPDGSMLASAGSDGTVRLWDLPGEEQIGAPLTGHEDSVWSVAFSSDGRTLASGSSDGTLRLWDVDGHGPAGQLPLVEGEVVLSVAFAPDGRTLASGSVGGSVRLWDTRSREPLGEPLGGHAAQNVQDVAFSPSGRTVASAGSDGTVRLWDVPGRRELGRPLRDHIGAAFGVAFSPDSRTVVSGGDDKTVRLWDGILWRDLTDLERQVCGLVVRNLTEPEWQELVPGLSYRTTCPT